MFKDKSYGSDSSSKITQPQAKITSDINPF